MRTPNDVKQAEEKVARYSRQGWSRLTTSARRHGLLGLLLVAGRRFISKIYRRSRLLIFTAPLIETRRVAPREEIASTFECRRLSLGEAEAFTGAPHDVLNLLETYLHSAPLALEVLMAFVDGALAGWFFVHVGKCEWPLTETKTSIELRPTDAVWTGAFTLPEFRGKGIYPVLIGACAERSLELGATDAVVWCEQDNVASRKNIERAGLKVVGIHQRVWLFGQACQASITSKQQ